MNSKKKITLLSVFAVILLVADQVLKMWVKTSFKLGESLTVFPDWFQLLFIENNGAAYGMGADFGDWGKIILSLLRVVLVCGLGYYIYRLVKRKAPVGILIGLTLILAGALGNILDSTFYGLIFTKSTTEAVAHFTLDGGYSSFMMGQVVDMFYFPLFKWEAHPQWLNFLFNAEGYFFGPVFNLADAYISVAVVYLLLFQYKFFK